MSSITETDFVMIEQETAKLEEGGGGEGGFPRRLTSGEIFNNRLLLINGGLLLSPLFPGNFCEGDKAVMEGDKVIKVKIRQVLSNLYGSRCKSK